MGGAEGSETLGGGGAGAITSVEVPSARGGEPTAWAGTADLGLEGVERRVRWRTEWSHPWGLPEYENELARSRPMLRS